jgi:hypothetical protein
MTSAMPLSPPAKRKFGRSMPFVAVAFALACLTLLAASFVAGHAVAWIASLTPGELVVVRAVCTILAVSLLGVAAVVRSRRSDHADEP